MNNSYLSRQPIFDHNHEVFAYEILYREHGFEAGDAVIDENQATSRVLLNAFVDIGLEKIVGNKKAFINISEDYILGKIPLPFSNDKLVLEIYADDEMSPDIIDGIVKLSDRGYKIAIDDFIYSHATESLLSHVDYVKIDLTVHSRDTIIEMLKKLELFKISVIAEKVETQTDVEFCHDNGFDFFQGFFLCEPGIIESQSLQPNRVATMKLLGLLQQSDVNVSELESIITQDVSLSFKILKSINSAFYGLPKRVESIHQALVYMGLKTIKQLATLLAISNLDDKPDELLNIALMRARMCELIASELGFQDKDSASTVGLLSSLDALMDRNMADLLAELPFTEEINNALLNQQGKLGRVLNCVIAYERGDWSKTTEMDIKPERLQNIYLQSIDWSIHFFQQTAA